jgi:hypothetical protein
MMHSRGMTVNGGLRASPRQAVGARSGYHRRTMRIVRYTLRLLDGFGAAVAAALVVLTGISATVLFDGAGVALWIRGLTGYLTVAALLALAAGLLLSALRTSFTLGGGTYEAKQRRHGLVLRRLAGYGLLALGIGLFSLLRSLVA